MREPLHHGHKARHWCRERDSTMNAVESASSSSLLMSSPFEFPGFRVFVPSVVAFVLLARACNMLVVIVTRG